MSSPLNGRTVLVTGAARGIGEHVARVAAARGARVALVGLEPDRLKTLADELGERHHWHEADVTDQAALDAAVDGTVSALGRVDVVVANAGVANLGTVAISPIEVVMKTIDVNLSGVIRTVYATLPQVLEHRGYYLLISSAAAFTAFPGMAAYCAAKAGVEQFGNVLRMEIAHRGVSVGTAHPSWVDTDMVRDVRDDLASFREELRDLPGPLGRTTSVQDCAETMVRGIERRKRRVYVPRSVAVVQALRSLALSPLADRLAAARSEHIARMEAEVQQLGRYFGEHSTAKSVAERQQQS
jgi:short-subunit dehydrogenase